MNHDSDFDWSSLEDHVTNGVFSPPTKAAKGLDAKTQRFPCTACGGTGKFLGARIHQEKSHCFACKGKGFFLTSERDRKLARQQAASSKAQRLREDRAAFDGQYPGLATFLAESASWSQFAAELFEKLSQYGSLTEGQVGAVQRMQAKCAERRAVREAEWVAGSATVDLAPIRSMFEKARGNGYQQPIYRAAGLVISRAPDHGRNPGALYVTNEAGDYLGKILGTSYTGKSAPTLTSIALDPRGEAIRYGQRTGSCACCGRTLTNHASIELGIGPICAEKWGLL